MPVSPEVDCFSSEVRRWVLDVAGPDAVLRGVEQLAGATSSTLYSLTVEQNGCSHHWVLRLFTNREWLAEEPDIPRHEAANLEQASGLDIPTPQLIACDDDGRFCGLPALLMTRLPGRVDLFPANRDAWLARLAETLVAIHTGELAEYPWRYFTYNDVPTLAVPAWSAVPDSWAGALAIVREPWPATRHCFIHRDYHPTNVLWQDGRISGVIDWPNACLGPPGIDVGHCRANLAGLYGVAAADAFLASYQQQAGPAFVYQPYWDLLSLIEVLPDPPDVYQGWIDFGVKDLTPTIIQERLESYLVSILQRC